MIKIRVPGGSEPAGALTWMLPFWSGKLKVIALGSKFSGATALVVKLDVGTSTALPNVSARPLTWIVYCVAGSRFACGANESTVPEVESTNGCKATGVPDCAVPFSSTRFDCWIDCGFNGAVVVIVMV